MSATPTPSAKADSPVVLGEVAEGSGAGEGTANVTPGVGIETPPPTRIVVRPGQREITVNIVATEPVPAGEIAYSFECYESTNGGSRAVDGRVHRSTGTNEFSVTLLTDG